MTVLRTYALPASIAGLGDIVQLAFMWRDFEAGLRFWSGPMGAGPFFVIDHVEFGEVRYRGAPAQLDLAVGIGYWGDLQIELVHQHNDAPSIFHDWRKTGAKACIMSAFSSATSRWRKESAPMPARPSCWKVRCPAAGAVSSMPGWPNRLRSWRLSSRPANC